MSWPRAVSDRGGRALLLFLSCLALAPSRSVAAPAPAGAPASVVARVNGKPILRRDFDIAVQMAFRQRVAGERGHEDLQAARTAVLETLIDNELLYQHAVQANTTVPEAEVQDEVGRLKTALGGPAEAASFLKENGVTEKDFVNQVRRSQIVRRFVDGRVGAPPAVSDADARSYYEAHRDQFRRPEAVHIRQIVVQAAPNATPSTRAQARSKAEAILKELRSGKDFAELARLHSDGAEAKRGGESGWVWAGGGALPSVERAALVLQVGQTSDIVESRRGFHIIKASERRPAGTIPFDDARKPIVDRLAAERRHEQVSAYVAGLRKSARIEKTP